jgi:CheY-like chemotaxis protein
MGIWGGCVAHILIVDDDPRICELLEAFLCDEGHEIRRAADGIDALTKIDEDEPDLIVTDLMMPRLDGAGLVDRLRQNGRDIPVIVISAVHGNASNLSVAGFVPKPFDLNHLADVVDRTLAEHASEHASRS